MQGMKIGSQIYRIRLIDKVECVFLGVGLKPSLCGQGLGRTLIINFILNKIKYFCC